MSDNAAIRCAFTGQSLINTRLDPASTAGWTELCRWISSADVRFTNLEASIRGSRESWAMKPAMAHGPAPEVLDDLRGIGFNLLSMANNHAWDFGIPGVLDALDAVRARGFVFAGTGRNLEEAAAPAYLKTPNGEVALIAAACGATPEQAGAMSKAQGGFDRPGMNLLRLFEAYRVPRAEFEKLTEISNRLSGAQLDQEGVLKFFGNVFSAGQDYEVRKALDDAGRSRMLTQIRAAAERAALVLVYIHQHHWEQDWEQVGAWLRTFSRDCIDAGAHAVLGHGVPMLQGIEVHRGRPIFYSTGNFIFQSSSRLWSDRRCWQSIVARGDFSAGRWKSLRLHPICVADFERLYGADDPLSKRVPHPAESAEAHSILERLGRLSAPLGTKLNISGDVGEILLES